MCLIAVAFRASNAFPLVVAANRDEAHARPTAQAHWWPDAPDLLGGRDLSAGGTWLAVDRNGRFAAVTNLRARSGAAAPRSRGHLVADFLRSRAGAAEYAAAVAARGAEYGPFNLLVHDRRELWFAGSAGSAHALAPGVHALSNVEPGVDWPKVATARRRVAALLDTADDMTTPLFGLLAETGEPVEGYGVREVSPFQIDPGWGTRSSTVFQVDERGWARFTERSFDPQGRPAGEVAVAFELP